MSNDSAMRAVSSEVLARLCRVAETSSFVNPLINSLIDQVINNRDPDARSGFALALGCIISHVGGMAAQSHLKKIVGILHSLAVDPNTVVHTWALHSLWLVVESAGPMYNQNVSATLSLIVKLFMAESHEPIMGAFGPGGNANADVYPAFGRLLYALVGTLGPELESSPNERKICFSLFEELKNDRDPFVVVEAVRCVQHFILFAPKQIDIGSLIPFLQQQLSGNYHSQLELLRKAAVTCLYQLVQKTPGLVLAAAVNGELEEQLFALLDIETDHDVRSEIKDVLKGLLKFVAPSHPSRWLELAKKILSKASSTAVATADPNALSTPLSPDSITSDSENDDEAIEVEDEQDSSSATKSKLGGVSSNKAFTPGVITGATGTVVLLPRWRTQVFALLCIQEVMSVVFSTSNRGHMDLGFAREKKKSGDTSDYLVFKVADLIRMAFSAATANVEDLRLGGLNVLRDILEVKFYLIFVGDIISLINGAFFLFL